MKDDVGVEVVVGDTVKILSVSEESLNGLEPMYAREIRNAVGKCFEVTFIDEHNRAWVDIDDNQLEEGRSGQTLFLCSKQIRKC